MAPQKGYAFTYNYDMTDPWSHIVDVVSIKDGGEHAVTRLTDGARAGIPEVRASPTDTMHFFYAVVRARLRI